MSIDKLKNKIKIISLSGFGQDTVLSIMVLIRESLESLNCKGRFDHVNFYCNWCVHSKLTKSTACYEMLKNITNVLISNPVGDNKPWYNDAIAEILDLKKLRLQLIDFFEEHDIPDFLFKNFSYWQHFSVYMREIVFQKKIEFPKTPNSKVRAIYNSIKEIADLNNGLGCKALWVTTKIDPLTSMWSSHWNIELFRDYVTCSGPFVPNEVEF